MTDSSPRDGAYLIGAKVYLRPLTRADLSGAMFQWANDPEVTHYMSMGTFPNTIEALEREYDALSLRTAGLMQSGEIPGSIVFAAIEQAGRTHIGNVALFGINWISRSAEFRAIFGEKQFRGGGYVDEAYRLLIGYAFDRLNLRRLEAGTRADNVPSIIALKKVGFKEEGRRRQQFLRNDRAYDALEFGILRDEFVALNAPGER